MPPPIYFVGPVRCGAVRCGAVVLLFVGSVARSFGRSFAQLIAEGSGEDEEADVELRRDAVDNYLDLLETPAVPDQVSIGLDWIGLDLFPLC